MCKSLSKSPHTINVGAAILFNLLSRINVSAIVSMNIFLLRCSASIACFAKCCFTGEGHWGGFE